MRVDLRSSKTWKAQAASHEFFGLRSLLGLLLRGEVVILGTQYAGEMKRPGLHP